MTSDRQYCSDCETPEGELHALYCTKERCPFCGKQLSSCGCMNQVLTLTQEELKSVEEFIDDSVDPLHGVMLRWEEALNRKGRVPYIVYPIICAKCGMLWPELFRVPDEEWERYIQIDMRAGVICQPCYEEIKLLIDAPK